MATRQECYKAIDSERAYQNDLWGDGYDLEHRRPEEWLVYIDVYLNKAKVAITSIKDNTAIPETIHIIRKITALGIAAMEQLGAPRRAGY